MTVPLWRLLVLYSTVIGACVALDHSVPLRHMTHRCLCGACFIGASVASVHVRNRCLCGACMFSASAALVSSVPPRRLYRRYLYGVRAIGASVAPVIGAFMASDLSVPVRR